MPFLRFVLPFLRPARWDLVCVAVVLLAVEAGEATGTWDLAPLLGLRPTEVGGQPWRLATWAFVQPDWVATLGNAAGLTVGLTMASRCSGRWIAWAGLVGSCILPGLWAWHDMPPSETLIGASSALYGALGMGCVAWLTLRREITYTRRSDRLAGFGTLGVVAFALTVPLLLEAPARWIHVIPFVWGAGLVMVTPRSWDS